MYGRKSTKRVIRRRPPVKKRKAPAKLRVGQAVKAYVKRAIKTSTELKHAVPMSFNNQNIQAFGISPNGPNQCTSEEITRVLQIPQGSDNGQRIGDKIRVKSLTIKGYVNLNSALANEPDYNKNPMYVKMFVGRRVDTIADPNTYVSGGGTAFNNLFQNGPTATGPLNYPSDMYRYVNKDVYRIYTTRFFKIGMSAPSNNPADSNQWNNDFKFSKQFTISLNKHIDVVKYFDGGINPTNVGIYVWFVCCWANGSPVTTLTKLPLEWHYDVNCTYYDA